MEHQVVGSRGLIKMVSRRKKMHSSDCWAKYKTNEQGYRFYVDTVASFIPRGSFLVLDLGCREGLVASVLAYSRDSIVHGLDSNPEKIKKATDVCTERLLACVFEAQNIGKINLERHYDYAVCVDVLENISTYKNLFKIMRDNVDNFTVLTVLDPKYHRRTKNTPRRMLPQDRVEKLFQQHSLSFKLVERKRRSCGGDLIYKLWNQKTQTKKTRRIVIRR